MIVGAGSWGTAIASLLASSVPTVLWARNAALARQVNERHENAAYLPGVRLAEALEATSSLADAVRRADLVLMAVPSHGFRGVLGQLVGSLPPKCRWSAWPRASKRAAT